MTAPLLLSLAILGITLLGWTSQWLWPSWIMDVASSFQLQYAIATLLLWLLLLRSILQGRTKTLHALLLIGLACLSFQFAMLANWHRPAIAASPPPSSELPLTLLSINVHPGMEDYGPLLELVQQEQPDFVFLQEATALSLQEFRVLTELPYSLHKVPPGDRQPGEKYPPKGTALFSRFPLKAMPTAPDSPAEKAGLWAQVQPLEDSPQSWLQLFDIHALVPLRPSFYRQRNAQLTAAFAAVQATELPTVVMGDFNTALWSRQLSTTNTAPLRPARQGFGILPTWRPNLAFPSGLQWLGNLFWSPIDHSYVSSDLAIREFRLGPDVNSDHLPIIVKISAPATMQQM